LSNIRSDIKQYAAGNNNVVEGAAVYIHLSNTSNPSDALIRVRKFVIDDLGWDLSDGVQKELILTHKLIARQAGYENLLKVYQNRGGYFRDRFLKGEDEHINFLQNYVEPLITAWTAGQTGKVLSILRANGFTLNRVQDKTDAKESLNVLVEMKRTNATIKEMLLHGEQNRFFTLRDDLKKWIKALQNDNETAVDLDEEMVAEQDFYQGLFDISYSEVSAFCGFLDEFTPFSTKHGVKGTEYETVFVVLDDKGAKWYQYSFDKYLSGDDERNNKRDRFQRTQNLFYVCCSRAKVNLAVVDLGTYNNNEKEKRVTNLFGSENCFALT
jgi:DNA helicase II / ATP-dependent DNA helicase PcrA